MTEKNVEDIEGEDESYSSDELYKITSYGADLSFRELIDRFDDEDLVKPELQRKYVWDPIAASRFIDSLLLGLPVPSIFLAKQSDEKMLIVDGYQRIMTVHDFVAGKFSDSGNVFKLSSSPKINEKWRGKQFVELSDTEKRRIKTTTIHSIIFQQDNPKDGNSSLFQVFERINTSGSTLMPQEIRNCIYQGEFNTLLLDLNENEKWRGLFGLVLAENRMRDMEFILRFFALEELLEFPPKTETISLKKYLNDYMDPKKNSLLNGSLEQKKSVFLETMEFIYDKIGSGSFFNINKETGEPIKRFHPTVFDSVSIAARKYLKSGGTKDVADLASKRLSLLKDDEYKKLLTYRTTGVANIKRRIEIAGNYLFA